MTSVGIIGSGFGAVGVAVELLRHGHTDVRLWEKADALGGVWRDNTYPNAGCDAPSPIYSYSWAPKHWSRRYAQQEEILDYIREVADAHGVTGRIAFGREVVGAAWSDADRTWTVRFADGSSETVDVLVPAVGQLSRPVLPPIPGDRGLRRPVVPLRAVGPRRRPHRAGSRWSARVRARSSSCPPWPRARAR